MLIPKDGNDRAVVGRGTRQVTKKSTKATHHEMPVIRDENPLTSETVPFPEEGQSRPLPKSEQDKPKSIEVKVD